MIPKAIVSDFDGVWTVGGEGLKQLAWKVLAEPWSEDAKAALAAARKHYSWGNGSRFDILHMTFRTLKSDSLGLLAAAYADAYNTLVQDLIVASGMPEGAKDVLDALTHICPLYINSATPEEAVRESTIRLGISNYFAGLFGQPKSKVENLRRALNNEKCAPSEMVFIGDGKGDRAAAEEFHCQFIGITNEWNGWTLSGESFPVVEHVRDLPGAIAAL
jgi:phosphoglycolate phosphatase-like HAD superfamily hydrolase